MEHINVNLVPGGVPSICHASQYDEGRIIRAHLLDGILPHTLSGTETIILSMRKPNHTKDVYVVENTSSDYVDIVTTSDMCSVAGENECKLIITDSSSTIGSANFKMNVESDAYGDSLTVKSVSGSIATFETELAEDLIKLDVDLDPAQDLHGYDGAWPEGGEKNKLPPNGTDSSTTINGITFTASNGVYTIKGTSTEAASISYPLKASVDMSPSTQKIVFLNTEGNTGVSLYFRRNGSNIHYWQMHPANRVASNWTDTGNELIDEIMISVAANKTVNMTISPMFLLLSETSETPFAPYSNICPISGHDSAQLFRTGKNWFDISDCNGSSAGLTWETNGNIITWGGTATTGGWKCIKTFTLPVGTYHFHLEGDGYWLENFASKGKDVTITVTDETTVYRLAMVATTAGQTYSGTITNIQIETGSTATPYETYISDPTPITVHFGQTVYEGHLDSTNRKVLVTKKGVKIKDLTWSYVSSFTYFSATVNDILLNTNASHVLDGLMCEVYTNRTPTQAGSGNKNGSIAGFNNTLRIKDLAYDNKDDLIDAVGDYLIVYPLAEPFYIDLSQPVPAGINKLPFEDVIQDGWTNTISDVTATYNNGVVHVEGTNNSGEWANIVLFINVWSDNPIILPAGTYIMSENLVIRCSIDGGTYANKSTSFTAESSVIVQGFYVSVKNGDTVDWEIPLMLINGTTRPTEYFPYYVTADPIRIPALVGENNVYSDAGDVEVEYYTIKES